MHPFLVLLHLAGAVMLLLWAVRLVRTGVERAHGTALKNALRGARTGGLRAAAAGCVLAIVLQSATAVGVLAAGFAASGILAVSTGIAVLLGADLGSALVVQILSFDLNWLIPILLVTGGTLFLKFDARKVKQTGRILVGIALILLALKMIGEATVPLRDSPVLPQIIDYMRGDPLTTFALAAALSWLIHSSVAAVLLLVTFANQNMLPLDVALPMVLGANLGGGLIAVWLTRGANEEARRIPLGNLAFRGTAAIAMLVALQLFEFPMTWLGASEARQLVNFHLAFNLVLVLLSLPFVGPMARLVERATSSGTEQVDPASLLARPASVLDHSVVGMPKLALASATRELLRMGETVETMFRPVMDLLDGGSKEQVNFVRKLDREVNRAHTDIKLFIAQVNRGQLSEEESKRGIELTDFAINLEHIGDIIAKTLMPLVEEKSQKRLQFSAEGWSEMTALHERVLANIQLALNVLVSEDLDSARQLVKEKELMRRLERSSHDSHLRRLQSGKMESIETSNMHLEVVRALKEINSLLTTVAYPLLKESGDLLESRLAQPAGEAI